MVVVLVVVIVIVVVVVVVVFLSNVSLVVISRWNRAPYERRLFAKFLLLEFRLITVPQNIQSVEKLRAKERDVERWIFVLDTKCT